MTQPDNNIIAYIGDENRIQTLANEKREELSGFDQKFVVVPKYGSLSKQEYGIIFYENGIPHNCQLSDCHDQYNRIFRLSIQNWAKTKFEENEKDKEPNLSRPINWIQSQFEVWYKGSLTSFWLLLASALVIMIILLLILWVYQYHNLYLKPINLANKRIINDIFNESKMDQTEKEEYIKTSLEALSTLNKSNLLNIYPIKNYIKETKKSLHLAQIKLELQEILEKLPKTDDQEELKFQVIDSVKGNQELKEKLIRIASESSQAAIEKVIESIPFAGIPWAFIKTAIDEAINDND